MLFVFTFFPSDLTSVWQPTRLPRPWDSPGKNTGVGCHFLLQCMKVKHESKVAQSCPTLSDPMDHSLPGSSVHGIFQAGVLEWDAIALSEIFNTQLGLSLLLVLTQSLWHPTESKCSKNSVEWILTVLTVSISPFPPFTLGHPPFPWHQFS